MRLTTNKDHPDFHDMCYFVRVFDQSLILKNCIWFDSETGEYECYETPLRFIDGEPTILRYKSKHLNVFFTGKAPDWSIKDWFTKNE